MTEAKQIAEKTAMLGRAMVAAETNTDAAAFFVGFARFGGGLRAVGSTFGVGGKGFARFLGLAIVLVLWNNGGREIAATYLGGLK